MHLSAQEVTATFFSLPEQQQQAVFDFMEFLKTKSAKQQAGYLLSAIEANKTQQTEAEKRVDDLKNTDSENYKTYLYSSEPIEKGHVSSIYKAFDEAGLIGCIETDEQLSTTYKEKIDFSFKHGEAK
jgi:Skp family chaperone for outer membrane proteins